MTIDNKLKMDLSKKGRGYAKIYSSLLKDEFQRKRSYACLCGLYALLEYLELNTVTLNIQKSMTLFRNPSINEEYEISDIYINGCYIDVRIITEGDRFFIPKAHERNDIIPDFYAVIRTNRELTSFVLEGFADTTTMKKEVSDFRYDFVKISELIDYKAFMAKIETRSPERFDDNAHKIFSEEYLKLTDNEIDKESKNALVRHLLMCEDCRREFCCFTGFEMVSINTSKYPELTKDLTLDIIGAQSVEKGEYAGEEETIIISDDEEEVKIYEAPENQNVPEVPKMSVEADITDNTNNLAATAAGTAGIIAAAGAAGFAAEKVLSGADAGSEEVNDESTFEDLPIIEEKDSSDDEKIKKYDENIITVIDDDNELLVSEEPQEISETTAEISDEDKVVNEVIDNTQETENKSEPINDDEKVFDILDELFSIDEEPEPLSDYDTVSSDTEIVGTAEDTVGSIVVEPATTEANDLIINIDDNDTEDLINEEDNEESNIQKVIVDYDENGLPLYSYITTIEENEPVDTNNGESAILEVADEDGIIYANEDDEALDLADDGTDFSDGLEEKDNKDEILNEEDSVIELTKDGPKNEITADNGDLAEIISDEEYITDNNENDTNNISDDDILDESADYLINASQETQTEGETDENFVFAEKTEDEKTETNYNEFKTEDTEETEESDYAETIYDSQVANFVNEYTPGKYEENEDADEDADEEDNEEDKTAEDEDGENPDFDEENDEYEGGEDGEDGEEYEEESDDDSLDFTDESEAKEKSKKAPAIIAGVVAAAVLVTAGIGGGTYYLMHSKNTAGTVAPASQVSENALNSPSVNDNNGDALVINSDNDMFGPLEVTGDNPGEKNQPEMEMPAPKQDSPQEEQPQPPVENNEPAQPQLTEQDLVPPVNQLTEDPNKAIANAFAPGTTPVLALDSVNWECTTELFTDKAFKTFLKNVDNTLKQNLKSNVLNATETPANKTVSAKMSVDNNGNLQKVIISNSSGSEQVDNIVLQSIKETFETEKTRIIEAGAAKSDKYFLTVVIKF